MPVYNATNTVKPFDGYIERNNYVFRVLSYEFTKGKESGEPMIVLDTEVVSPETCIDQNGKTINVSGAKWKNYLSFSPKAAGRTVENLAALGIVDFNTDEDVAKEMVKKFEGMVFNGVASCDKDELCRPLTLEQKARGERKGTPILDDATKQPIIQYRPKIERFLGLSSVAVNRPF